MNPFLRSWMLPAAAFVSAAVLAIFAGPTMGALSLRQSAETTDCPKDCPPYGQSAQGGSTTGGSPYGCSSTNAPIRYYNGQNMFAVAELQMTGLQGWTHGRAFYSDFLNPDNSMGLGWTCGGNLRLWRNPDLSIVVYKGGLPHRSFSWTGSAYIPRSWYKDTLVWDQVNHRYFLTDINGRQWRFTDFVAPTAAGPGVLTQFCDQDGSLTTFVFGTSGATNGRLLEVQQTDVAAPTSFNKFTYNYFLSGISVGFLSNVTQTRTVAGVSTMIRKVDYTYYGSSGNGPQNSLQFAKISDATGVIDVYYYRYYGGLRPVLKYVLGPTGYGRALKALSSDAAIDASSDPTLAQWALYYFEYDFPNLRVTKEVVQGQGCGCGTGGGKGTYTYSYRKNPSTAFPGDPNVWVWVTTEVLPDLNVNYVYTTAYGETLAEVFSDTSTGQQWITAHAYDEQLREVVRIEPSGITGVQEANPWLYSNNLQAGLYRFYDFSSATNLANGTVAGYRSAERVGNTMSGPTFIQRTMSYTSHSGATGTIYPLATEAFCRNTDGSGTVITNYSYTWQGTSNRILQATATTPAVPGSQNGSGVATTKAVQFDAYGRVTWSRDEGGFITHSQYDNLSGGMTLRIEDVNTNAVVNEPAGWVTPGGGGLHIVSSFGVDALGRVTQYTDPIGNSSYAVYKDSAHEMRLYMGWDPGTNTPTGPTEVLREDRLNNYKEFLTMTAAPAVSAGKPTGTEAVSGLQTLTRAYLDNGDRVVSADSYFNLSGLTYSTGVNLGVQGTNFYRQSFGYSLAGRPDRIQDWTGTIIRKVRDSLGRVQSVWVGTDDSPTTGDWSPTNTAGSNLLKLQAREYDANSNLTKTRLFTSATASVDTLYAYDFRNRQTLRQGADKLSMLYSYNNLSLLTQIQTFADANSNGVIDAGELRGQEVISTDDRGAVYQLSEYNVNPATGVLGNRLTSRAWYNSRGQQVKIQGANGQFIKSTFDGVGRVTAAYLGFDTAEVLNADALHLGGDTIIEQTLWTYDNASNVLQTTGYRRGPAAAQQGDLSLSWTEANARRTYLARWYDRGNRLTHLVDYGTNGGTALVRPATPPAPPASDTAFTYLESIFGYDAAGRRDRVTDTKNRTRKSSFDGLGRVTKLVENFVDGTATEAETDSDRTSILQYDAFGRLSQRIQYNPKGTASGVEQQVTKYVYGTTANQAAPATFRNDLLAAIIAPDSDDTFNAAGAAGAQLGNGTDAAFDRIEFTYDYAGRRRTRKDQRGNVRTFSYDAQGRFLSDVLSTVAAGTDAAVRRMQYSYDSMSRVVTSSTFDATSAGNTLSQIRYTYDGWGNETTCEQSHSGAVVSGTTPAVRVAFADGAASGEAKYVRKVSTTYPNGGLIYTNYPSSGIGDKLNRISAIASAPTGGSVYAQYSYLGANDFLDTNHPAVTNGLVLRVGSDGSPTAWDRFDRMIQTKWRNTGNSVTHDMYDSKYDRTGNRISRDVGATGAPATKDELYAYDGLDRLTNYKQGTLDAAKTAITGTPGAEDQFTLDEQGNWKTFVQKSAGVTTLSQTRAHNKANEVGSISAATGTDWIDPVFDRAGNVQNGPKPSAEATRNHYTYDAWNRLVRVQADNAGAPGTTIAEYQYDAAHRRVAKLKPNGANWDRTDYYFTCDWQVAEERSFTNGVKTMVATAPRIQYVWDLRYLDAPIVRFRDADNNGSLEETLYYTQDAVFNTTALVNPAGAVVERYTYDPYGKATVLSPSWTAQSASTYANEILFGGYRFDPESGLYAVRFRAYNPGLGRWMQRDPLGDSTGLPPYEYAQGNPVNSLDAYGLLTPDQFKRVFEKMIHCKCDCEGRVPDYGAGMSYMMIVLSGGKDRKDVDDKLGKIQDGMSKAKDAVGKAKDLVDKFSQKDPSDVSGKDWAEKLKGPLSDAKDKLGKMDNFLDLSRAILSGLDHSSSECLSDRILIIKDIIDSAKAILDLKGLDMPTGVGEMLDAYSKSLESVGSGLKKMENAKDELFVTKFETMSCGELHKFDDHPPEGFWKNLQNALQHHTMPDGFQK